MLQLIEQRTAGFHDVNILTGCACAHQNILLVDEISNLNDSIQSKRVHIGTVVLKICVLEDCVLHFI